MRCMQRDEALHAQHTGNLPNCSFYFQNVAVYTSGILSMLSLQNVSEGKEMEGMFKRILVPLDGSERAEQALPVSARVARGAVRSVMLLLVVDVTASSYVYLAPTVLCSV